MPMPPPAARMVATIAPTAIQRPHVGRGAGDGGMYGGGGPNQPSGAGGGAGIACSCGTISLDWGSISDIGSTPFCIGRLLTTMPVECSRSIRGSLEFAETGELREAPACEASPGNQSAAEEHSVADLAQLGKRAPR